ncbi:hypothetical protein SUT380_09690 [Streptococcus parasuis]|nr:hypothetical protein SUT380_09690 [Streptococcus parasuis]
MKEIEEVIYPFTPSKIKDIKNSVETLIKEQYVLANEHIRKVNKDTEKYMPEMRMDIANMEIYKMI